MSLLYPTTPTSHRTDVFAFGHVPLNSSPLSSSPTSQKSSPVSAAQSRRRSQYKSQPLTSSSSSRTRHPSSSSRKVLGSSGNLFQEAVVEKHSVSTEEPPRKAFLRERFKARCFERAQKDRERKLSGKRMMSQDLSSDGLDALMDCEDEEDDDTILNDEFFSRIVASAKKKTRHAFRVSYALEVGSSLDPELDDINQWEHELQDEPELSPSDLEALELEAYAREAELFEQSQSQNQAEIDLLEGIPLDDIFSLSDLEDYEPEENDFTWLQKGKGKQREVVEDVDMDI